MDAKHTPGPWTPDVQCGDVRSPVGDVAVAVYAGMRSIGITGKESTLAKITRGEAEANARLIAAAPMLLEALAEAEEFVDRHSEAWYTSGQALLVQIRAAIALATGAA
jgi:hypothetical protein